MNSYSAYGLGIHSEIPVPEFIATKTIGDVFIRIKNYSSDSGESIERQSYLNIGLETTVLSIHKIGKFLIHDGCEIIVNPAPNVDIRLIQRYLAGSVMALLLYQRGHFVLHASAVNIKGCATLLLGYPGAGKSSLAAALFSLGHEVITDDVSAINIDRETAKIFPGFPQLKLSIGVAKIFGYDSKNLIILDEHDKKRGYRFVNRFSNFSVPVRRVYVVKEEDKPGIERISPQEAVIEFIRHSIPTRFAQPGNASHLLQCISLAKQVDTFRLRRSYSTQKLPTFAKDVEEHIMGKS